MNEEEHARCTEFSLLLFGKELKKGDVEDVIGACASLEEFRIAVVSKLANRNEFARKVAVYWRENMEGAEEIPDANALLHLLENISKKETDLEMRLRESTAELLDKMKAIDSMATVHATWKSSLAEVRYQLTEIRKRLELIDELPRSGKNVSK